MRFWRRFSRLAGTVSTFDSVAVAYADKLNPDYQPPKMRWCTVEIISSIQMDIEYGMALDSDGILCIISRKPGEDWPIAETPTMTQTVTPGKSFVIENGEREPRRNGFYLSRNWVYWYLFCLIGSIVVTLTVLTSRV